MNNPGKNAKKKSQKMPENDISCLTDILPGRRGSDIVLVRNFHHTGSPRYYRDILESITFLNDNGCSLTRLSLQPGISARLIYLWPLI